MLLRCHTAFGNFVPGDELEVPDGAVYDRAYFGQAPAKPAAAPAPSKREK